MDQYIELPDSFAGSHIIYVCEKAVALADAEGKPVRFIFNETVVIVQPGETKESVSARWQADMEAAGEAYRASDEYKKVVADRAEKERLANEAHMVESAQTETEMREADVPWPRTESQLLEYISSLSNRQHDYGTCVYAMSMAATAAFYYMAHKMGSTGFQSSCADMDVLRRTRSIKGPFMLIQGANALYPQYDLPARLAEAMEGWRPWLKEEAAKLLLSSEHAHPDVVAHWKSLANFTAREAL